MAEPKTKPTKASVRGFIDSVDDATKRKDCRTIMQIMKKATGASPKMWGPTMVGYGTYHYRYASGRGGNWFLTGFSPRKQNLTLYIMSGFKKYDALMSRLGKHKTGKACLYIKRLEDVDLEVLAELVQRSVEHMKKTHS